MEDLLNSPRGLQWLAHTSEGWRLPLRALPLLRSRLRFVPFVNRPFESEIHGTVNFTYFCCFVLVTWCHRVLLSCYLRPSGEHNLAYQEYLRVYR